MKLASRPSENDPAILLEAIAVAIRSGGPLSSYAAGRVNAVKDLVTAWHPLPAMHMRNLVVLGWAESDDLHDALCSIDVGAALDLADLEWAQTSGLKMELTVGASIELSGDDWIVVGCDASQLLAWVSRGEEMRIARLQADGSLRLSKGARPARWDQEIRAKYAARVIDELRGWAPSQTPTEQLLSDIATAVTDKTDDYLQHLAQLGWKVDGRLLQRLSEDELSISEDFYNATVDWVEAQGFPEIGVGSTAVWLGLEWLVADADPILGQLSLRDGRGRENLVAVEDVTAHRVLVAA